MKIRRILCWLLSLALLTGSIYTADTLVRQRRLARKTVRLHVIANSDEAADQAQKLRVRDGVLACVSGLTADCETADDARNASRPICQRSRRRRSACLRAAAMT